MNGIDRIILLVLIISYSCKSPYTYYTVEGKINKYPTEGEIWLSHEHILVDFIGAMKINKDDYSQSEVINTILPKLKELHKWGVKYFVDATPNFLGRDPNLLKELSRLSGIQILTNTGFYGAVNNKYIPKIAFDLSAEEIADIWIDEFENGIGDSGIKPGFIKIGVDAKDPLHPMHQKLVKAAALTHLQTGLTIASHTGKAKGLWPQLEILKKTGVSPSAFIWVHAQNETNPKEYKKAAEEGCWISLDGMGWNTNSYNTKLQWAKENDILDKILISHDAGWFDPQKSKQEITPYTNIFEKIIPQLKASGFTDFDFNCLLKENPAKAFNIH
ncbi:phosphotriesterase family protein [Membranihabitans maritimus]|uniref:phosphotriesterase family protein n=1 Tax=Membranihabitans maritimus TaxID=2904244 RepID=UPI001F2746BE|nr:hypothetical protein [Membranihabitans maritimus]